MSTPSSKTPSMTGMLTLCLRVPLPPLREGEASGLGLADELSILGGGSDILGQELRHCTAGYGCETLLQSKDMRLQRLGKKCRADGHVIETKQ
jgi:hypothetical protein